MNGDFEKECRDSFNKVGIYGGIILGRLVGYCETEEDCYFIIKEWTSYEGPETHRCSMVGGFDPLPREGFEYTYRNWDRMVPEAEEFILEVPL